MTIILSSCITENKEMNPLLAEFDTPFGVPPFGLIRNEHYIPAFQKAIEVHDAEIEIIASNPDEPTFENTIAAFDYSGELYGRVSGIFYNLKSANTDDELQSIARELVPVTSAHSSNINMNSALYARIKAVYQKKDSLGLTREEQVLLEKVYKRFVRNGAELSKQDQERLREIDKELAMLSLKFGDNVLAETNKYKLVIKNEKDLAGLPAGVVSAAAEAASEAGEKGNWVFTLHKPSWIPFLTYSDRRELREELYKAMYSRCNNDDEYDNKKVIKETIKLRTERAKLLGYSSHADYVLEERMAENIENVNDLLMKIWNPAIECARNEAAMMQDMIDKDGEDFKLESWDWWYYAEKIRQENYELNDEEVREYFSLEDVTNGVFLVLNKLYGVTFERLDDLPVYHEDVFAYELKDSDGSHLGIQYMDFFPRPGKGAGAWSTSYRRQHIRNGEQVHTIGAIVCNFTKPDGDTPALLSFDEVLTYFHEIGHAMHGQFAACTYPGSSGAGIPRDFVELPSQIMENWASDRDIIKQYARNYRSGEAIPEDLLDRLEAGAKFNKGFETTEQLAASILDMDYHSLTSVVDIDVTGFEQESMNRIGLISEIIPRYKSTYFKHIFSGGYSAGYYSYIWAEVLDKDAFRAFEESGDLFNQDLADSFRKNILSMSWSVQPVDMYLEFRGKMPDVGPLLEARGLGTTSR